jgi:hypothetical protein
MKTLLLATIFMVGSAWAHTVTLKWQPSSTLGLITNLVYKSNQQGQACGSVPYAVGVDQPSYQDPVQLQNGQSVFYNVAAEDLVTGEISGCAVEIQVMCRKNNKCQWRQY